MIDNNSILELAETLIHECLHRTVYVAGESEFNENLAEFVGRKGASILAERWINSGKTKGIDLDSYRSKFEVNQNAQKRFQEFLPIAKKSLEEFYKTADKTSAQFDSKLLPESEFLGARKEVFERLRNSYLAHMNGVEKNTYYEHRFLPERFNNAVFLGYTLYEAHHEPFEKLFEAAGRNLKTFVSKTTACFNESKRVSSSEKSQYNSSTEWAYKNLEKCGVSL
jgi:predicted aminopeptidase